MSGRDALPGLVHTLIAYAAARRAARRPAAAPALLPAAPLPPAAGPRVFRDYGRRPGERGAAGVPEYRCIAIWSGREVDEGFTFDRAAAERILEADLGQLYDVELWAREAGDWQLIKRGRPVDGLPAKWENNRTDGN